MYWKYRDWFWILTATDLFCKEENTGDLGEMTSFETFP